MDSDSENSEPSLRLPAAETRPTGLSQQLDDVAIVDSNDESASDGEQTSLRKPEPLPVTKRKPLDAFRFSDDDSSDGGSSPAKIRPPDGPAKPMINFEKMEGRSREKGVMDRPVRRLLNSPRKVRPAYLLRVR